MAKSIKIWGRQVRFLRVQNVKNVHKACKNLPFFAEIVKFGLILTHMKLFSGARKYVGDQMPLVALPLAERKGIAAGYIK